MPSMKAKIVKVTTLTSDERVTMFHLLEQYYDAICFVRFEEDLASKDDVILLLDGKSEAIKGFSTLKSVKVEKDGKPVYGLFSGDTVVDRDYWGQRVLGKAFLKYLFMQKAKRPFSPLYWLLISKGYKTYLLLANNFREHYPRYERETPVRAQSLLDEFARALFPKDYNQETGLIVFAESLGQLKAGIADIPCEASMLNPRIQYFAERNPTWAQGTELMCIAEMRWSMPLYYGVKSWWKLVGRRRLSKPQATLNSPSPVVHREA